MKKNSQLNVQLQTLDQLVWKEPRNPNTPRAVPGIIDVRKAQPESTEKPESSADSAAKAAREETISQARFLLSPALDQPSFHVPGCGIAMSWKREGSSFVFTEELEDETWEFRVSGTDGSQTGKKVIKKTN